MLIKEELYLMSYGELMYSKEINTAIIEIEDSELSNQQVYKSCVGDKIIPYAGWFWRTVNFDADEGYLGILPSTWEHNSPLKVAFMENNKWDYEEFKVGKSQWQRLRELIVVALEERTKENFKSIDKYMQSLLP